MKNVRLIDDHSIQFCQTDPRDSYGNDSFALGSTVRLSLVDDFINTQVKRQRRRRPKKTLVKNHRMTKKGIKLDRQVTRLNCRKSVKTKEHNTTVLNTANYPSKECQFCLQIAEQYQ